MYGWFCYVCFELVNQIRLYRTNINELLTFIASFVLHSDNDSDPQGSIQESKTATQIDIHRSKEDAQMFILQGKQLHITM